MCVWVFQTRADDGLWDDLEKVTLSAGFNAIGEQHLPYTVSFRPSARLGLVCMHGFLFR